MALQAPPDSSCAFLYDSLNNRRSLLKSCSRLTVVEQSYMACQVRVYDGMVARFGTLGGLASSDM